MKILKNTPMENIWVYKYTFFKQVSHSYYHEIFKNHWVQLISHYNFPGNKRHSSNMGNGEQHNKWPNENRQMLKWMILTKYYSQKGKGSKLPEETNNKKQLWGLWARYLEEKRWNSDLRSLLQFLDFKTSPFFILMKYLVKSMLCFC